MATVWYEPFGIIIVENLKYGTPVLGSNIGGIPEIIKHDYNGLLFKAGNVTELRDLLGNLVNDPIMLGRLSEGAFKSAEKYDIKQHVHELVTIYRQVGNG